MAGHNQVWAMGGESAPKRRKVAGGRATAVAEAVSAPAPGSAPGSETSAGPGPAPAPGPAPGPEAAAAPGPGVGGLFAHLDCPITLELMVDPVTAADGRMYERTAIERVIKDHRRGRGWSRSLPLSPTTNEPLANDRLLPAVHVRQMIESAVEGGFLPSDVCEDWLERDAAAKAAKLEAIKTAALGGDAKACVKMMERTPDVVAKQRWAKLAMTSEGPAAVECRQFYGGRITTLPVGEFTKTMMWALFTAADPNHDNCAQAQGDLALVFATEPKLSARYALMALGKTRKTRDRTPEQSRLDKQTHMMCTNIWRTWNESSADDVEENTARLTDYYAFMKSCSDLAPQISLGLPPQVEGVAWHDSVSPEQAAVALIKWKVLMAKTYKETAAYGTYLRGFSIKRDCLYDLAWRVFLREGGIGPRLPPGSFDVIGKLMWPGLGVGDPRSLTDEQARAIAASGFPCVPLKRLPEEADDAAVAEHVRLFRTYTRIGFRAMAGQGLIINSPLFLPPFGPAPGSAAGSAAAGPAAGPAAAGSAANP